MHCTSASSFTVYRPTGIFSDLNYAQCALWVPQNMPCNFKSNVHPYASAYSCCVEHRTWAIYNKQLCSCSFPTVISLTLECALHPELYGSWNTFLVCIVIRPAIYKLGSEYKHVLANILRSHYVARTPPLEARSSGRRSNVENAPRHPPVTGQQRAHTPPIVLTMSSYHGMDASL